MSVIGADVPATSLLEIKASNDVVKPSSIPSSQADETGLRISVLARRRLFACGSHAGSSRSPATLKAKTSGNKSGAITMPNFDARPQIKSASMSVSYPNRLLASTSSSASIALGSAGAASCANVSRRSKFIGSSRSPSSMRTVDGAAISGSNNPAKALSLSRRPATASSAITDVNKFNNAYTSVSGSLRRPHSSGSATRQSFFADRSCNVTSWRVRPDLDRSSSNSICNTLTDLRTVSIPTPIADAFMRVSSSGSFAPSSSSFGSHPGRPSSSTISVTASDAGRLSTSSSSASDCSTIPVPSASVDCPSLFVDVNGITASFGEKAEPEQSLAIVDPPKEGENRLSRASSIESFVSALSCLPMNPPPQQQRFLRLFQGTSKVIASSRPGVLDFEKLLASGETVQWTETAAVARSRPSR